jgi:hypothetical protein
LLSGKVPPPALDRRARDELVPLEHLVSTVPSGLSDAIMQALAVEPEQRPQDVQTFQALLMRDGELTTSTATLPPTVASIIATCPNCNVTNSVPAGRALADTTCAQCGSMLSGPVTTSAPTNASTRQIGVYPTFFAMATRKGQSIAAATAVVLLLLGGGLWAKQSYDKSLAEEQTKRMVLEQELKQKELAAKKAEEARLLAAEQERKQQEETEKRQLKEQIEQLAAAQQKLEAEKQKAAERPNAAAAPAAPVDPEVADMRRERQLAEERARKEEATRKAEIARERREEQRRERAEIRRKERELAEAESKLRTQSSSTAPAALPGKSRDETGALDSMTDMACKFLGTCDPRFRSNNK